MVQRYLRTTSEVFDAIDDKSIYNDSIIFIEDTKQIWTNGIYYASVNAEEVVDGEDIEDVDISNFSGDAKDVTYISEFVEYNNVQDILDYLLRKNKELEERLIVLENKLK